MARQTINNSPADSGLGDSLFVATTKLNQMTLELYAADASFADDIEAINELINGGVDTLNHTHTINQIIGLQTALSGKVSTSTFNTQILAINSSIQAINSTLSEIIDILNTKIGDAPFSGVTYGRRDGAWVEVTGGGPTGDFVPYTGGTKDVVLSANSITANGGFQSIFPTGHLYAGTSYAGGDTRQFNLQLAGNDVDFPATNSLEIYANVEQFFGVSVVDETFGTNLAIYPGQSITSVADVGDNNSFTIAPTITISDRKVVSNEGFEGNYVKFNTTNTETIAAGKLYWNDVQGTMNIGLKGGQTNVKSGVDLVVRVVNKVSPNTTLTKAAYQAVRISGAQGQRLAVELARANNENNSADTIGLVCETINANQEGFIMTVGQLENINTTGNLQGETWNDGDVLYLSPTTAGRLTNVKPSAPGHIVVMGYVEYAHQNNGKIYVKIMNGWELDELHNVNISAATEGQVLTYESATDLWKNKTIVEDAIVNGVTSRAPSQNAVFDAFTLRKRQIVNDTVTSTVSGTTTSTIVKSYQFLPGTLTPSGFLEMYLLSIRSGASLAHTMNVFINTTNSLSGATLIGGVNTPGNFSPVFPMKLFFVLKDNLIVGGLVSQSTMTNLPSSATGVSAPCNNTINSVWILVTITPATTTQVISVQGVEIIN
jgi:hypothetical protein